MKKKTIIKKQNKELLDLVDQWNNLQVLNTEQISNDYFKLFKNDFGLLSFFEEIWMFGKLLWNMVWENKFNSYNQTVDYCYALLLKTKSNLSSYLTKMFNTINGINIAIKFKRFDNEIKQYELQIQQKQNQSESNPLVVKRKIDILNQKINQVKTLKNQFISTSKQRSKQEFENFKMFVDSLLDTDKSKIIKSLNNVISETNQDELDKLKLFFKRYWANIVNYLNGCIDVVNKLRMVKIKE